MESSWPRPLAVNSTKFSRNARPDHTLGHRRIWVAKASTALMCRSGSLVTLACDHGLVCGSLASRSEAASEPSAAACSYH